MYAKADDKFAPVALVKVKFMQLKEQESFTDSFIALERFIKY